MQSSFSDVATIITTVSKDHVVVKKNKETNENSMKITFEIDPLL